MGGHLLIGAAREASPPQPSISMYLAQSSAFSKPGVATIAANSGPYRLVLYFPSGRVELFDIAREIQRKRTPHSASASPDMVMALIRDIERRFCDSLDSGPPVCSP